MLTSKRDRSSSRWCFPSIVERGMSGVRCGRIIDHLVLRSPGEPTDGGVAVRHTVVGVLFVVGAEAGDEGDLQTVGSHDVVHDPVQSFEVARVARDVVGVGEQQLCPHRLLVGSPEPDRVGEGETVGRIDRRDDGVRFGHDVRFDPGYVDLRRDARHLAMIGEEREIALGVVLGPVEATVDLFVIGMSGDDASEGRRRNGA